MTDLPASSGFLAGKKRRGRTMDRLLKGIIQLSAILSGAVLVLITVYVTAGGLSSFGVRFVESIFPMVVSTLFMILFTLLITLPVGILSAIYLKEFAGQGRIVSIIRFSVESLAGIPSIIYGLFGMIFFVTTLGLGWSILSGVLTMAIMILPTILRTTEEALAAVPASYREGSLALGASRLTTVFRIVLPAAVPGILAAVILGMGRIVGETAAIYMTAGTVPRMPSNIMDSGRTLSVHLYMLAKEGISFDQAFSTAMVLLILVALLNGAASRITHYYRKSRGG